MHGFTGLRNVNQRNTHDTEHLHHREHETANRELEKRAEKTTRMILANHRPDGAPLRDGGRAADGGSDARDDGAAFIGDLMSKKVVTLKFDDNLMTVRNLFSTMKFHHIPIVEPGRKLIGIVSDRDFLLRMSPFLDTINEQARDKAIMRRRVGTIMTRDPICARADTTVSDAVRVMDENNISCLPVVEDDGMRLLGIVTWKDLVRSHYPDAVAQG